MTVYGTCRRSSQRQVAAFHRCVTDPMERFQEAVLMQSVAERQRASYASLLRRLEAAQDRIHRLTAENASIRRGLGWALGDARAERLSLMQPEDRL